MDDLKIIETYTRGNIDETEKIPVEIHTHNDIDDGIIKMINNMPFYKAERFMRFHKSKLLRKDNL